MVSTRGVKFKFSEGERVLCYELDTNKARLLYDSKILEICVGRDSGGRKCAEYLVHFYGWNSSWDRCVAEDNIVKDSTDNRHLQRKLAEQAAIALRGKKVKLNKIPAIIKEIVVNSSNNSNNSTNSSAQINCLDSIEAHIDMNDDLKSGLDEDKQEINDNYMNCEDDNDMMCRRSESLSTGITEDTNTVTDINASCDEHETQTQVYIFSNELKLILDNDHLLSAVNKCLYELPIKPNAVYIIDNFNLNGINLETININTTPTTDPNQYQILLKEFKSSLLIYFNALIENDYLFYNEEEKEQFLAYRAENDNCEPSKMFGFIHLLRFLVSLNEFLLSTSSLPKKHFKIIVRFIQLFIEYLTKNRSKY